MFGFLIKLVSCGLVEGAVKEDDVQDFKTVAADPAAEQVSSCPCPGSAAQQGRPKQGFAAKVKKLFCKQQPTVPANGIASESSRGSSMADAQPTDAVCKVSLTASNNPAVTRKVSDDFDGAADQQHVKAGAKTKGGKANSSRLKKPNTVQQQPIRFGNAVAGTWIAIDSRIRSIEADPSCRAKGEIIVTSAGLQKVSEKFARESDNRRGAEGFLPSLIKTLAAGSVIVVQTSKVYGLQVPGNANHREVIGYVNIWQYNADQIEQLLIGKRALCNKLSESQQVLESLQSGAAAKLHQLVSLGQQQMLGSSEEEQKLAARADTVEQENRKATAAWVRRDRQLSFARMYQAVVSKSPAEQTAVMKQAVAQQKAQMAEFQVQIKQLQVEEKSVAQDLELQRTILYGAAKELLGTATLQQPVYTPSGMHWKDALMQWEEESALHVRLGHRQQALQQLQQENVQLQQQLEEAQQQLKEAIAEETFAERKLTCWCSLSDPLN